jgi:hypothetical protein
VKTLKNPMFYLFLLFMADYLLTYYGIRVDVIEEGNPIWVAILDLPFHFGLPIRILYFALIVYLPVRYAVAHPEQCRPSYIKGFYVLAFATQAFMLIMHTYWIFTYNLTNMNSPVS